MTDLDFGCIADDFTGATDLAIGLKDQGFAPVVILDPEADYVLDENTNAVIFALKSRTTSKAELTGMVNPALERLSVLSPRVRYFKYCSTFDSTDEGNIGPTMDLMMDWFGLDTAIIVPSSPENGRTVYQGHLFVWNELLSDSPMRFHPLTPMKESKVARILAPQTHRPVSDVSLATIRSDGDELLAAIEKRRGTAIILDAIETDDLARVAAATPLDVLFTGGAGLGTVLEPFAMDLTDAPVEQTGGGVVLAGSASTQTRAQLRHATHHAPHLLLDPAKFMADYKTAENEAFDWLALQDLNTYPIVHTVDPFIADGSQHLSTTAGVGDLLERALAALAKRAYEELGVRRFLIAGGETSGAVATALGIVSLKIGRKVGPGVCWSHGTKNSMNATEDGIDLLLKSGNFGADDLFTSAWRA